MILDPRKSPEVQLSPGTSDRDVCEACVGIADRFRDGAATVVLLVAVRRRGKVVGDSDFGPFPAFCFVGGGDGDLRVGFVGQCVNGGVDGFGAVVVDEFNEGLEVSAGGIVFRVVL
ncbi:hypothetical protein EES47_28890 [Streptomyces sp. ADI98-12]|nr:hypothetical protein EES47_28890 [Streptomyces sp. ADI98-12]